MPLDFLNGLKSPFFDDTRRRRPGVNLLDGLRINNNHYRITNFINDSRVPELQTVDGIKPITVYLPMPDGVILRGAVFLPKTRSVGTRVYVEGKSETIEIIQRFANANVRAGRILIVFDLRGQGGSGREIDDFGAIYSKNFADYRADLRRCLNSVVKAYHEPGTPLTLMPHSLMGAVTIPLLANPAPGDLPIDALLEIAPMFQACKLPKGAKGRVIRDYAWRRCNQGRGESLAWGQISKYGEDADFVGNWFTTHEEGYLHARSLWKDPDSVIGTDGVTNRWIVAYYEDMYQRNQLADQSIDIPTRVVMAEWDWHVRNDKTIDYVRKKFAPDSYTFHYIEDWHALMLGDDKVHDQLLEHAEALDRQDSKSFHGAHMRPAVAQPA